VTQSRETLLVTLTGPDRPGVTAALFTAIEAQRAEVLDVEQVVIRGQLILGVLLASVVAGDLALAAHRVADKLGMQVSIAPGVDVDDPRRRGRLLVTILGAPLRPHAFAAVAVCIAEQDGNIDSITRVASHPVTAIELEVSGSELDRLRTSLAQTASANRIDIAVQRAGLRRRGQLLVVMDVDSTFIQDEVIELLADAAGCRAQVERITAAAMAGELDFRTALEARVALLSGAPAEILSQVQSQIRLTAGALTLVRTLHRLGYHVGLVSGGFLEVVGPIAAKLGITHFAANGLEVADGRLTGRLRGPVIDRAGKAAVLQAFADELGIPLSRTIAVGDGANDIDMLALAGLGVAFNAKEVLRDVADTSVTQPYLDSILFLLGITREEVEEASIAEDS